MFVKDTDSGDIAQVLFSFFFLSLFACSRAHELWQNEDI